MNIQVAADAVKAVKMRKLAAVPRLLVQKAPIVKVQKKMLSTVYPRQSGKSHFFLSTGLSSGSSGSQPPPPEVSRNISTSYLVYYVVLLHNCPFSTIVLATRDMAKIAIIETGGKQYTVTQDSVLSVEKISDTAKQGDKISFDKVLLIDDGKETKVGAPYLTGAKIAAEVIEVGRAPKVTVIRYRQKSRYYKKRGHRQPFTKVRITSL